jgi:hypothetical protein
MRQKEKSANKAEHDCAFGHGKIRHQLAAFIFKNYTCLRGASMQLLPTRKHIIIGYSELFSQFTDKTTFLLSLWRIERLRSAL